MTSNEPSGKKKGTTSNSQKMEHCLLGAYIQKFQEPVVAVS